VKSEKFAAADANLPLSTHLSLYRLLKFVKLSLTIGAVAEETDTDALPVATSHGKGVAGREIAIAISAVEVLVAILFAVVGNLEVKTGEGARLDERAMAVLFDENAVFAETDACEQLAGAEETGIAVASGFNDGGALTLIADDLLGEHVATEFETVGRLGVDRQIALALGEAPAGVIGVVVPLPNKLQI